MAPTSFRAQLHALHVSQIERYLTDRKWKKLTPTDAEVQVFRLMDDSLGDEYLLKLNRPESHQYIDYLYKLVFHISCIEQREPNAVAHDMMSLPRRIQSEIRDICMESLFGQLLAPVTTLSNEAKTRLLDEIKPQIAHAHFVSTAGSLDVKVTGDALTMKWALVLIPWARLLEEHLGFEKGLALFNATIADMFAAEQTVEHGSALFQEMCTCDRHAPAQALSILKVMQSKVGR